VVFGDSDNSRFDVPESNGVLAELPKDIHLSRTLTERRNTTAKRKRIKKNSVMQARVFVKCPILFGYDHPLVAVFA
jgi:hypothetical protein